MITVFTPTYNRGHILAQLYLSLKAQTCKDFEWLIVDDGSTDNTEEIVRNNFTSVDFPIRYFKQKNGGKHRAINLGVKEAKGDLFFIVDSDDYLSSDAIEFLSSEWSKIRDNEEFVGISGTRVHSDGSKIGDEMTQYLIDCSNVEMTFKLNYHADMAEAWRTNSLRQNPFKEFKGENFITESSVWIIISNERKVRFFNRGIYICDYLEGGLTSKMNTLRYKNPNGTKYYYAKESKLKIPFKRKLKSYVNYWRFAIGSEESFINKVKECGGFSLIGFIPGLSIRFFDFFLKKNKR